MGRDSQLTQYGAILGTIAYLSPEACVGEHLDERTDIWAFGLLLYEMLAGQRPFAKRTSAATLMAILQDPVPDIRLIRPDLPDALVDLLQQMLAKDKEERIPSVRLAGATLESLLRNSNEDSSVIQPEWLAKDEPVVQDTSVSLATPPISAQQVLTPDQQAQLILLDKVYAFWIEGVLQQSLHDGALIDVGLETMPDVVANPWQNVISKPSTLPEPLPADKPIAQIFAENGRSLLILGQPGSGKTVLLLKLARALLIRAKTDPNEPIPVVFNLSAWANRAQSLAEWLVDELNEKYLIPRKIGQTWVDSDRLLLLLDGLDEVPTEKQANCIQMINQFRQNNGLVPIALCCRSLVYENINERVLLNGAISLRSLTSDQANKYLDMGGEQLERLHEAIHDDPILQEIATSPLMLQVMSKAFRQEVSSAPLTVGDFPASDSQRKDVLLNKIFDSYVNQMVIQLAATSNYRWEQAQQWLIWLAHKMSNQNQTVFLVESLQPSFLLSRRQRWLYMFVTRILLGAFIGLIVWMFGLIGLQLGAERAQSSLLLADSSGLALGWVDLIMSLSMHCLYGFAVALVDIYFFERRSHADENIIRSKWDWPRKLVMGTVVAIMAAFQLAIWGEDPALLILQVLAVVFLFVLFTQFAFGQSYADDVGTVEALRWSWKASSRGVLPAVVLGAAFSLIIWQLLQTQFTLLQIVLLVGLIITLLIWSLSGITGNVLETKARANEGIRLSAKNGMIGGFSVGTGIGILATMSFFVFRWQGFDVGRLAGVYTGFVGALIAGLLFGGFNVVNHYFLRFILWRTGQIPKDLVMFLNDSARHVLLYKVGGGFIFIHGLLQEHLSKKKIRP